MTTPGLDLLVELRRRRLPYFSRPRTLPLSAHPVHAVWLTDVLQVFDLLTLLAAWGDDTRPPLIAAGPAAAELASQLEQLTDLHLEEADLGRWIEFLLARGDELEAGEVPDLDRLQSWVSDHARAGA